MFFQLILSFRELIKKIIKSLDLVERFYYFLKIFLKRAVVIFLLVSFLFFPLSFDEDLKWTDLNSCDFFLKIDSSLFFRFFVRKVLAATLNPGSNFVACALVAIQPAYTTESYPDVTVYWSFSGSGSQKSYRVQIDDDLNFGSVNIDSGTVTDSSARSYRVTSGLSFGTKYYWRLMITDSFDSVTDWIIGEAFMTNKPSIKIKGGTKLKGGVKLK